MGSRGKKWFASGRDGVGHYGDDPAEVVRAAYKPGRAGQQLRPVMLCRVKQTEQGNDYVVPAAWCMVAIDGQVYQH